MDSKSTSSRTPIFSVATARIDVIAGLVSSTVAIPLAMAFGMFAFVTLGDEYFAYGAMAGPRRSRGPTSATRRNDDLASMPRL
jgi:MFS superfamily sulfate permease-like transporter